MTWTSSEIQRLLSVSNLLVAHVTKKGVSYNAPKSSLLKRQLGGKYISATALRVCLDGRKKLERKEVERNEVRVDLYFL